jgi:hypothetical protein
MSLLEQLKNTDLVGITFIRDYIQLLLDGPVFNIYTLPNIHAREMLILSTDAGYYDTLCSLIGKKILLVYEDEKEEKIVITLSNNYKLIISLKIEDKTCAEAAMLYFEDSQWKAW